MGLRRLNVSKKDPPRGFVASPAGAECAEAAAAQAKMRKKNPLTAAIRPAMRMQPPRCKTGQAERERFQPSGVPLLKKECSFQPNSPHVTGTIFARFRSADERRSLDGRERRVGAIPFLRGWRIQCRTD